MTITVKDFISFFGLKYIINCTAQRSAASGQILICKLPKQIGKNTTEFDVYFPPKNAFGSASRAYDVKSDLICEETDKNRFSCHDNNFNWRYKEFAFRFVLKKEKDNAVRIEESVLALKAVGDPCSNELRPLLDARMLGVVTYLESKLNGELIYRSRWPLGRGCHE